MTIALLGLFALLGVGISWSRKGITFNVVLAAILLAGIVAVHVGWKY